MEEDPRNLGIEPRRAFSNGANCLREAVLRSRRHATGVRARVERGAQTVLVDVTLERDDADVGTLRLGKTDEIDAFCEWARGKRQINEDDIEPLDIEQGLRVTSR